MKLAAVLLLAAAGSVVAQGPPPTKPIAIQQVKAVYPKAALVAEFQGTVVLQATIQTNGTPTAIKVMSVQTMEGVAPANKGLRKDLSQSAINCLHEMRFKPATLHGKPVVQKTTLEIVFKLD